MSLTFTDRMMKIILPKRHFINYVLSKSHKRVTLSAGKAKASIDGLQATLLELDSNIANSTESLTKYTRELELTKATLREKANIATETQMRTIAQQQVNLEELVERTSSQLKTEKANFDLITQSITKAKNEHGKLEAEVRNIESRIEQVRAMKKANLTLEIIGSLDVKESLGIINGATTLSEQTQKAVLEQKLNQNTPNEEQRIKEIMSQNAKELGT